MTSNKELMAGARQSLKGNWTLAVLAYLIAGLLSGLGGGIGLIIGGPIMVGAAIFTLNIVRKKDLDLAQLFDGFKKFVEALLAYLLVFIFTFLWTLLFIIPGIIAAISYSQTFYILAEEEISAMDAVKKSKQMMQGNKWKYFCLGWRFFGWMILAILTLGIGLLWLIPYMQVSYANFYLDLKK